MHIFKISISLETNEIFDFVVTLLVEMFIFQISSDT